MNRYKELKVLLALGGLCKTRKTNKMENHPAALKLARKQRFKALQNAFSTIDEFANCSLNPEQHDKYEDVKKDLLENYGLTDEVKN